MSKIVVLKTEGKGRDGADFVTVMLFDKTEEADSWCKEHTDLECKHWTFAEIINTGEKLETWYGENI